VGWGHVYLPWLRQKAEAIGVKPILKRIYRGILGDPVGR